jgi:hypothetical protein
MKHLSGNVSPALSVLVFFQTARLHCLCLILIPSVSFMTSATQTAAAKAKVTPRGTPAINKQGQS